MFGDSQDRQHNATQNSLQTALQEGRFARSQQMASLLFLVGALTVLLLLGRGLAVQLVEQTREQFVADIDISGKNLARSTSRSIWQTLSSVAPMFATFACIAYLAHAWQSGFRIFPNKLSIDPSRISISQGVQKLFTGRNFFKAIGGIARLLIVVAAGLYLICSQHERFAMLAFQPRETLWRSGLEIGCWIAGGVMVVMLLFAIIDYIYQFNTHQNDLKLTDQEYRDELKSLEGDPVIRSQRRSRHAEMAQARLSISATPLATHVVFNRAGEVAAIKLDEHRQATLIAKGANILGRRMLEIAQQNQIRIIADEQLATYLSGHVEIHATIADEMLSGLIRD